MNTTPKLSFCSFISTKTTAEEDIALTAKWGFDGISVCEMKLDGTDEGALRQATENASLAVSACIPRFISPLPLDPHGPFSGEQDPDALIAGMSRTVRRLAPFAPYSVVMVTGPIDGEHRARRRAISVEGLREAARTASSLGTRISIEAHMSRGVSFVQTLPETIDLIEEIGEPNVDIAYDVWHLWDTPDVHALTEQYAKQIGTVHVCDRLEHPAVQGDRGFAGEGSFELPPLFAALERGGFTGWYDVEVFSSLFDTTPPDDLWRRARETWDRTAAATAALA